MNPKVTVLMPVYNGETYLKQAIESILHQTFSDFEFLIINDGSTDASVEIVESIRDPRILLVHNESNLTLVPTLNKGLELACGEYVARMDCDDISLPERLATQVAFMDHFPDVGVCGAWVKTIGAIEGNIMQWPSDDATIRCGMLFKNMITHPSVIIRKELIDTFGFKYDPDFKHAEDYELWVRCAEHTRLANINEVLLHYRWHDRNISSRFIIEQQSSGNKIRRYVLKKLGIDPSDDEYDIHFSIAEQKYETSKRFIERLDAWLSKIKHVNNDTRYYPETALSKLIFKQWYAACTRASELGWWTFKKLLQSPLSKENNLTFSEKTRFAIKCILKTPTE